MPLVVVVTDRSHRERWTRPRHRHVATSREDNKPKTRTLFEPQGNHCLPNGCTQKVMTNLLNLENKKTMPFPSFKRICNDL